MTRKTDVARRSLHPAADQQQAVLHGIHDLQARLARQRVRSLEIETHLALARRVAEQRPESASNQAVIRHLEKMLRVTEGLRRQADMRLDRLWEKLR